MQLTAEFLQGFHFYGVSGESISYQNGDHRAVIWMPQARTEHPGVIRGRRLIRYLTEEQCLLLAEAAADRFREGATR